jgi:hypothetical protein
MVWAASTIMTIGAVGGSLIAANASGKASDAQAAASETAGARSDRQYDLTRADQLKQYEQVRTDQAPYRAAGSGAIQRLSQRMGIDTPVSSQAPETREQIMQRLTPQYTTQSAAQAATPGIESYYNDGETYYRSGAGQEPTPAPVTNSAGLNAAVDAEFAKQQAQAGQMQPRGADFGSLDKKFTLADYQADPGYQFRLDQGELGIKRAASARGGQYSGATLKALANFNSGLASQEYGNAYSRFNTDQTTNYNRLAGLAGTGQTANTAVGNAGNSAFNTIANAGNANANAQGQYLQNAGEARASGYVGTANAIGRGIKQVYNNWQQNQPPAVYDDGYSIGQGSAYGGNRAGM